MRLRRQPFAQAGGGEGAIQYVTIEEANGYFAGRLHSEKWDEATEENKQKAITTATKRIDMQRIAKTWDAAEDAPQAVKDACCEEALALLTTDMSRLARIAAGIDSVRIGDASESYSETAIRRASSGEELLSPIAKQLLSRYIVRAVPIR